MKDRLKLKAIIQKIKSAPSTKIVIIGDVMLDHYIIGNVERISPEAPVPVLNIEKEEYKLGGAANVANNLKSLGSQVELIGLVGCDLEAEILRELLKKNSIDYKLYETNSYSTITKTRIISKNQQLLRIDKEKTDFDFNKNLLEIIKKVTKTEIVIVSDYGKGTISKEILEELHSWNKKILIDPKKRNFKHYRDCYLITPNKKEAEELSGIKIKTDNDVVLAGLSICEKIKCKNLLITLGSNGMVLFEDMGKKITHLPAMARNVYDVTGAGDTVVSAIAHSLSKGLSLLESCIFANVCAGIVVSKLGTAVPTWDELEPTNGYWHQYVNIESWNLKKL